MSTRVEIDKRLMVVNSASSLAARLISVFILVWLQQYLLRRISPEEYSLLPVVYAVMAFVPLVTTVMTGGIGRYVVEAYANDDGERVSAIVTTMVPLLCGLALSIGMLAALFIWKVDWLLTIAPERVDEARLMLGILFLTLLVRLVLEPFSLGLYVKQRFVLINVITLVSEVVRLVLLCVLLFGLGTRVLWVVVASSAAEMTSIGALIFFSRLAAPELRLRRGGFRGAIARELVSFGGWTSLGQIARVIRQKADIIVLNKLATAVDVNCMYLGSLAYNQIRTMVGRVTVPIEPPLVAMYAANDTPRLRSAYLKGGKYVIWASLFVATPLIVFREEVFQLYLGGAYDTHVAAGAVTAIVLIGLSLASANEMVWKIARAAGDVGPLMRRLCTVQLANLGLTIYLVGVHRMGAIGAALSSLIMVIVSVPLLYFPEACRLTGLRWSDWIRRTILPGYQPAVVMGFTLHFLQSAFRPQSWATLASCGGVGALVYLFWLLRFCLEQSERRDAKRLLAQALSRVGLIKS
jgi:O-antigen/teichoic acid export membrane protein